MRPPQRPLAQGVGFIGSQHVLEQDETLLIQLLDLCFGEGVFGLYGHRLFNTRAAAGAK